MSSTPPELSMIDAASQDTVLRIEGAQDDFEGITYAYLSGASVLTLGARYERIASLGSALFAHPPLQDPNLEPALRTFESPEQARAYLEALVLAASDVQPLEGFHREFAEHVLRACNPLTSQPRLSRWTWGSPWQNTDASRAFLHDAPTTSILCGGPPQWLHPRPSPRDPNEGGLMSCVVQFSGDLDPALGGPDHRYYLFGPGPTHGLREIFTLVHQRPYSPSSLHRLLLSQDSKRFALLCIDLVQTHSHTAPRTQVLPPLPLVLYVWKGDIGERGQLSWTQLEARTWLDVQREMEIHTQGLRDEGFELYDDGPDTRWLFTDSQPEDSPPETAVSIPLKRVFCGYWIQTPTVGSTVEDEILNRVWPGVGGQPDSVDTELQDRTFRRGLPSLPVLSLEPSSPLDHPYLPYYDTGLAHLLLQPLDDLALGAVWTGYVACSLGDPTSLVP